jgi:cell division protein FtsZ
MKGARGVLINITGGADMTLFEVDEAANRIREEVDADANIIFGSTFDESLEGLIRVSVVATGIEGEAYAATTRKPSGLMPLRGREKPAPVEGQEDAVEEIAAELPETAAPEAIDPSGGVPSVSEADADILEDDAPTDTDEADPGQVEMGMESEAPALSESEADRAIAESDAQDQDDLPALTDADLFPMDEPKAKAAQPPTSPEPVRPREAFIPPKPARPDEMKSASPDAFAEAAMANGSGRATAKPKPKQSLFSRMTGLGLGAREEEAGRTAERLKPAEPTLLKRADGMTPQQAAATQRQTEGGSQSAAAQQTAPAAQQDEPAPTRADEEMLEIPAFLRRQAN